MGEGACCTGPPMGLKNSLWVLKSWIPVHYRAAQFGKGRHSIGDNSGHFIIDTGVAEIGAEGHAQAHNSVVQSSGKINALVGQCRMIPMIGQ